MTKNNRKMLIANSLDDIFSHIKNVRSLQILGAGTHVTEYDEYAVSVRSIKKLKQIEKHEKYIDFGSAVTLSEMLSMGKANMPPVLYDALQTIGTQPLRNLGTLGGNICAKGQKLTLYTPLLALDARLTFEKKQNKSETEKKLSKHFSLKTNGGETINILLSKFKEVPKDSVLTKIHVPFDDWEVSIFKRVGPAYCITPLSAGFAFLVDTQKKSIANIKIAFAGATVFRSHEFENKLIGSHLPLDEKFIHWLIEEASRIYDEDSKNYLDSINSKPILKQQFLNLLRYSLEQLT